MNASTKNRVPKLCQGKSDTQASLLHGWIPSAAKLSSDKKHQELAIMEKTFTLVSDNKVNCDTGRTSCSNLDKEIR